MKVYFAGFYEENSRLVLKELLVQIILSTVLVVILAFIVFKLSLGDGIIRL